MVPDINEIGNFRHFPPEAQLWSETGRAEQPALLLQKNVNRQSVSHRVQDSTLEHSKPQGLHMFRYHKNAHNTPFGVGGAVLMTTCSFL